MSSRVMSSGNEGITPGHRPQVPCLEKQAALRPVLSTVARAFPAAFEETGVQRRKELGMLVHALNPSFLGEIKAGES